MGSLIEFDTGKLELIVDSFGLKQGWINILGTSILERSDLIYILSDPAFEGFQPIENNLLEGLSIGEIGVLYEYCVAREDHDSRKANGQYFTPDDVACFMVSKSKAFPKGKWLDPCSGIGNLSWHLVNAQQNKEEFLINSLVLSDKDELALFIARFLLATHFQNKRKNLFTEIGPNFIVFDFLSVADSDSETLFDSKPLDAIPDHDFVIVNPPYLDIKSPDWRFETAKSTDLYAYFLENIIKSSKGFISVTPQSFTNAKKFESLRSLILQKYSNIKIYNFDNIPGNIFHGIKFGSKNSNTANSMRAAITVAIPGPGQPQISSLFRWRSSERSEMFMTIDKFLACPLLSSAYFPKVSLVFEDLYNGLLDAPRLGSLCSNSRTPHALYVPSAPRYFISALKNPVSRVSQRTLYFRDEKDMNRAYLLMNSSLMYWWWRVRDGGMTLSLATILSTPLPDIKTNSQLVAQLLASEGQNKVFKRNAGVDQENIKHPRELVAKLNKWIVPEYSDKLILTHENSELAQLGTLKPLITL